MADDAGALLVRSGLVSSSALDEARARVESAGGTLGEQLVAAGVVPDDKLTQFYQQRLLVPKVNPNTLARLPKQVVGLIPAAMAVGFRAIPISLDADNNLTIAMSDPSDRHAVDEIAYFTGTYVVRAVATQMQIAWCLAHYYGHLTDLGARLLKGDEEQKAAVAEKIQTAPRSKSITEQVKALRTKRIERGQVAAAEVVAKAAQDLGQDATMFNTTVGNEDAATPVDSPAAKPRGQTAGEIRAHKRAESVKPPLPDNSGPIAVPPIDSGPVITIEASSRDSDPIMTIEAGSRDSGPVVSIEADEPPPISPPSSEDRTARKMAAPRRKKPAQPDPPELAARAGEVQLATGIAVKAIDFDVPSIMISDDLEHALKPPAAVAAELKGVASEPAMIHSAAPPAEIEDEPSDVIELAVRKPPKPRTDKITVVGVGAVSAATRAQLLGTGTPVDPADEENTDVRRIPELDDPTRVDAIAAPPPEDYTSSSDELLAAPPAPSSIGRDTAPLAALPPSPVVGSPPPSGQVSFANVKRAPTRNEEEDEEEIKTKPTRVMSAVELDDVIPDRISADLIPAHLAKNSPLYDPLDDGWGPPGSTIPPPLLGAIPGSVEPQSGVIPIPDVDSAPLMVAPPSPPVPGSRSQSASESGAARVLEESTMRVLELIRTLDHTTERDQIIAVMIAHLAESHSRAGFFVTRNQEMSLFAIIPRVPTMPVATLRLDRPSTLGDVVGTRLPYRGPMHDDASRVFLQSILGACPAELLLVPIAVRDRVVGVLFADQRMRHTFDDQLALAARAAGMALERILKAKRG